MNAYVKENIADALIGSNTFQVRRSPIKIGLFEDEECWKLQRRPKHHRGRRGRRVARALPKRVAVSLQSGLADAA